MGILVREKLSFTDDVTVSHFVQRAGTIRITVQRTDDPEEGAITLVFNANPLMLRQWVVLDALGRQTSVTLTNVRTGLPLDPELFKFEAPERAELGSGRGGISISPSPRPSPSGFLCEKGILNGFVM